MEKAQTREFVLKISALWNAQKRRESLYLEALKKDSMGSLRRILSQGHFSAVLFQKEICWIYDYFKCFMNDKELGDISVTSSDKNLLRDIEEKEEVASVLKKNEGKVLQAYRSLVSNLEGDSETRRVLREHLDRISEFYEILSKQESDNITSLQLNTAA